MASCLVLTDEFYGPVLQAVTYRSSLKDLPHLMSLSSDYYMILELVCQVCQLKLQRQHEHLFV